MQQDRQCKLPSLLRLLQAGAGAALVQDPAGAALAQAKTLAEKLEPSVLQQEVEPAGEGESGPSDLAKYVFEDCQASRLTLLLCLMLVSAQAAKFDQSL